MATGQQAALEYAKDQMQQGKINAAQANVLVVQMMGVKEGGKLPREVRKALNDAVKAGELGHIKKDGFKPEVYHHKNGRANAIEYRNREYRAAIEALNKFAQVNRRDL